MPAAFFVRRTAHMPLVKNQIIPLTIDALSSDGNGVGRFEGQAVFVPFAAVGDVLSVKVVKICKSYAFGIVESVLTPGTGRIPADCPIFGRCGGCCFRHLSYEAELAAKQGFVADALRRIGGLDVPVRDILPSPQTERYRNKVQYPLFLAGDGSVQAGFYASRSHRPLPCGDCLLQPGLLNRIAATLCALLTQYHISVYDEQALFKCIFNVFTNNKNNLIKTRFNGIMNGIIHNNFTIGPYRFQLFNTAAKTRANTCRHNYQGCFHLYNTPSQYLIQLAQNKSQ